MRHEFVGFDLLVGQCRHDLLGSIAAIRERLCSSSRRGYPDLSASEKPRNLHLIHESGRAESLDPSRTFGLP